MESTQKGLTMADVAGWGSAVVTFGLIQGALYLKAYWGHFGLDPFQFVAVSELALAGLAGIGMVLFLILIALLFGGWVEVRLTSGSSKNKLFAWLGSALLFHRARGAALVVERMAYPDRGSSDHHMCAGRISLASGAENGEKFPLADLCLGDVGIRFDCFELAWFRACQDDFLWLRQARDGRNC